MSKFSRQTVMNVLRKTHKTHCGCSVCSGTALKSPADMMHAANAIRSGGKSTLLNRGYAVGASDITDREYAFELSASSIRFGPGATREVGMDFKNMGATKVALFTDKTVGALLPGRTAVQSLEASGVPFEVFDDVRVEPNVESWEKAIAYTQKHHFSHFLAVGGGSVMDTAKIANLFSSNPDSVLLDYVNAPVGKGKPVPNNLKPIICIPTTAGTGSETTGAAIFDYTPMSFKTGISSKFLRPQLGICDPLNTESCPVEVQVSAGLDVLFHSLESYTALPYTERARPTDPSLRPVYQGRNPISDVFSLWALEQTVKYLPRVYADPSDFEARSQMMLAATFAGIGFGNAGVHLCHGLAYPISGLNYSKGRYKHAGYEVDHPIVPHGVSVAITGPAVFDFISHTSPDRHRKAAEIFNLYQPDNLDLSRIPDSDVGKVLHDRIARFLVGLNQPRGLKALGYQYNDIQALVEGTLPQKRIVAMAPGFTDSETADVLAAIVEKSLEY